MKWEKTKAKQSLSILLRMKKKLNLDFLYKLVKYNIL